MSSSKASTSANTSNQTHNQDNRLIVEDGAVGGTASAGGVVNIHNTDGGAFELAKTTVSTAYDSFGDLSKLHERTYDALIDQYDNLIQAGKYIIDKNTDIASKAVAAYSPVTSGGVEMSKNNTIALAAVGALALIYLAGKK
jgi:hypothetical protein